MTAPPSPTTSFATYLPHLTSALDAVTTEAANLPSRSDLNFHRTLDRKFARELDDTSAKVLGLAERLLGLVWENQNEGVKGKKGKTRRKLTDEDDVVDGFRNSVVEVVDGLLEDADSCLDELNGQKKVAVEIKPSLIAAAGKKIPGPFTPQSKLPYHLMHASALRKPQLSFPDAVNNSPNRPVWKPTLTSKPHSMVPLDFVLPEPIEIESDDELDPDAKLAAKQKRERDMRARSHPYYYETKHLPYPTSLFSSTPPIQPKSFEETPFKFVDTPDQLLELEEILKKAKEIAVDLEHHDMRSYSGFTCLMQISTREGDWVVDTLRLRGELRERKLGGVMVDPSIIKVFHGSDSDILWLQQDFDIYVVNLFDTYHACTILELSSKSLAGLLALYCDFQADKRYQMADWRIRPLPKDMLHYARSDTHFLLFVYDNLRDALLAKSSRANSPSGEGVSAATNPQQAMREVLNRSEDTALRLFERNDYDERGGKGAGGWLNMSRKLGSKDAIHEEVGYVFRKLHAWRDGIAREEDESPHHVLPNQMLISLSLLKPQNIISLNRTINGRSEIAQRRSNEILAVIKRSIKEYPTLPKEVLDVAMPDTKTFTPGPTPKAKQPEVQIVDVWENLHVAKPTASVAKAAKSSLFGSSLNKGKIPTSTPGPVQRKAESSLFGNALAGSSKPKIKEKGNGKIQGKQGSFESIQAAIHKALVPAPPPTVAPASAPAPAPAVSTVPEQVPFIPSSSRTTVAPPPEQTKTKVPTAEDGIVTVKKKKRERSTSSLKSGDKKVKVNATEEGGESGKPVATENEKAKKPKKKAKPKMEDIPSFDYSTETNLLDDTARAKVAVKAKKAKMPKTPVVDTSLFRKPPMDPSQPKGGNRSATFK
ncbi:exosome complex exonuclease RRP6, partial [Tremellales sp. Uapishka_1]